MGIGTFPFLWAQQGGIRKTCNIQFFGYKLLAPKYSKQHQLPYIIHHISAYSGRIAALYTPN